MNLVKIYNKTQIRVAHVECKPRVRRADEDLHVLPLGEMSSEILPACLGNGCPNDRCILINAVDILALVEDSVNVGRGLVDVALDVHSESRSLRDGEPEVEGNDSGDATETNEETPHRVDFLVVDGSGIDE